MSGNSVQVLDRTVAEVSRVESASTCSPHHEHAKATVRVGVIGYGYWGPNIVRNFHGLENCQLVAVCDKSAAALKRAQKVYPALTLTTDFADILTSPDIDA